MKIEKVKTEQKPPKITKREIDILIFKIDRLLNESHPSELQKA
ncbi:hypothetical protein [Heyndrickxia oleronia]|uniref:Uncharacterized protein n=1 Tax=Heyndrickxia oleronia TaxID=38875 RepID=A0AAW6SYN8_9BACI|nr:hypothetical protein [Heyndrickxia oleronia]MDH5163250.1 hypothetical protein [Heyndrickxia oleronia]